MTRNVRSVKEPPDEGALVFDNFTQGSSPCRGPSQHSGKTNPIGQLCLVPTSAAPRLLSRKLAASVHQDETIGVFVMAGSVGIFWGIPKPDGSWTILIDATSLAEAEPYGDFLTHPRGHYEVWSRWQKRRAVPLSGPSISEAIAHHEYEDFPRGRIVYNIKTRQFILYADRRLQQEHAISSITGKFGLAPGTFVVRSDAHYRS